MLKDVLGLFNMTVVSGELNWLINWPLEYPLWLQAYAHITTLNLVLIPKQSFF
jgi:hypothetical protein